MMPRTAGAGAAPPRRRAAPAAAPPPRPPAETGHVVKSPMVGTFYRSASPGAKPFVEVGSAVKEGEPICIIEAMKIMNEIEADKAGTVTKILVRERPGGRIRPAAVRHRVSRALDVQEDPDRQSRRDRPAHPARLPRAGRQVGRRLLRGRPRRQVREARRRGGLHRPGAVGAELPQHAGDHLDRRGDRRRGDPPRLRLPVGERRLRRARRAQRLHLHRPDARVDPHHGRQGLGQAGDDQVRRALRARLRGRAARRPEGDHPRSRARSATR